MYLIHDKYFVMRILMIVTEFKSSHVYAIDEISKYVDFYDNKRETDPISYANDCLKKYSATAEYFF